MELFKKIFYTIFLYTTLWLNSVFSAKPEILSEVDDLLPWSSTTSNNIATKVWWTLISNMIKYVAVIAVIALMISWIMYLLSWGEEEKVKKAKSWIIWSLVWVFLSISAMWIIEIINNIYI